MFEGLDEQIKHDDLIETTPRERLMKWIIGAVIAIAVFGGLYLGLHFLQ